MKPRINHNSIVLLIFVCNSLLGQINDYQYKRSVTGITETWNRIIIPEDMYAKVTTDFSDIRIVGFTEEGDTIEAPYLLEELSEHSTQNEARIRKLNFSKKKGTYYFTYEVPNLDIVNEIQLVFREDNFNYDIKLEGSNQLIDWYVILDNYRILSIKNNFTDYVYSNLHFNDSKYRYYRISFENKKKPKLLSAAILKRTTIKGTYQKYVLKQWNVTEDKNARKTVIDIELPTTVPVSFVQLKVQNNYDYFRPVLIQYLIDSAESPKGTIYNYSTIASNVLSSLEPNIFKFSNTFLHKLRILVSNNDNEPLTIDSVEVQGNMYEMKVRITAPADYYLIYGNKSATHPVYDLVRFKDKIPVNIPLLNLGQEQLLTNNIVEEVKPIFEHKIWLWGIMVVIILILGGFTVKMLKK